MASGGSSSSLSASSSMVVGMGIGHCAGCYEDPSSFLSVENILQCQKVSDFLIALAYLSIPLELVYFVSCYSIFPFRWIFFQFGCFIVFCGLTHFVNVFTFSPHSFVVILTLTIFKFLTALVSVATAVTLLTIIPQLLRVLVREGMLRKKTHDLDREVGMLKQREEASWHVRMLTREIRRSLDQNTILYTTLVELSKVLFLKHCAIWMPVAPEAGKEEMLPLESGNWMATTTMIPPPTPPGSLLRRPRYLVLTHETKRHDLLLHPHIIGAAAARGPRRAVTVPMDDPDVSVVIQTEGAVLLGQNSCLACHGDEEELVEAMGTVAAIRLPLLKAADFKTSKQSVRGDDDQQPPYAILVLALASEGVGRLEVEDEYRKQQQQWTEQELEMVEAVADQVAVALSHAAVLEDSLAVRKQLLERNAALKKAQQDVEMAECARMLFRQVMSREIATPARSSSAFLSMLQLEQGLRPEQRVLFRGGFTLSSLIEDATVLMDDGGEVELRVRPVALKGLVEEVRRMTKMVCSLQGASLDFHVSGSESNQHDGQAPSLPDWVVLGDERRILHAVLYMAGSLLGEKSFYGTNSAGGEVLIRVNVEEVEEPHALWKNGGGLFKDSFVKLWFHVSRSGPGDSISTGTATTPPTAATSPLPLSICGKLAELMNGELSTTRETSGLTTTILQIRLKVDRQNQLDNDSAVSRQPRLPSTHETTALDFLRGVKVVLADGNAQRRYVSQQVLRCAGCDVKVASSWGRCLEFVYLNKGSGAQVLLLDLAMLDEDGQGGSGRIRKLRAENSLLVIGLVGRRKASMEKGARSGLHGTVGSPVVLQELVEELQRLRCSDLRS